MLKFTASYPDVVTGSHSAIDEHAAVQSVPAAVSSAAQHR